MAGLTALPAFYSSSVRPPAAAVTRRPGMHTHIISHTNKKTPRRTHAFRRTCSPFQKLAPGKAVIGSCQVFGSSVESAPPLLGSIKAAARWKTRDTVFCVGGAKRNPIHTSLTRRALKRLLSAAHKGPGPGMLLGQNGCASYLAEAHSTEEQKTEWAIYCSKRLCF